MGSVEETKCRQHLKQLTTLSCEREMPVSFLRTRSAQSSEYIHANYRLDDLAYTLSSVILLLLLLLLNLLKQMRILLLLPPNLLKKEMLEILK